MAKQTLIIHKKSVSDVTTNYYFTKTKKLCLVVRYNKTDDYGKSTSFTDLEVSICYNNSFIKDNLFEIKIDEVPTVIQDALSFLSK